MEQEFNSLHAQRKPESYIASQRSEGWVLVRDQYDDGGISAALNAPPAALIDDIVEGRAWSGLQDRPPQPPLADLPSWSKCSTATV